MIFLSEFFIFSIGIILGLIPPFLWGIVGGDESIIEQHPKWAGWHMYWRALLENDIDR